MASKDSPRAERELAFLGFSAEFSRNGFVKAPEGLVGLLENFRLKPEESPEAGRARLYKRLWCILWFGNSLGKAVSNQPTYVYPPSLKAVIRQVIPGDLVDRRDPTGSKVYKVNIGDLAKAKWPTVKKNKK